MQPVVFNKQQALADGYSPQQIDQYLATRQQQGVSFIDPSQSQAPQPTNNQGSPLDWLPVAGSIAGSFTPLGPILGGAAGGAAGQGLKELFGGGGNLQDVAKEGLLGGVGGVAGKALSPIFRVGGKLLGESLPKGLDQAGNSFIASQYNVPRSAARALNMNDTIAQLSKYGINNINDVVPAADQVTGANGIISKLTRKAIAGASPVDTNGIMDLAKSLTANPAITDSQSTKFEEFIKKGLQSAYGGPKGSLATEATPEELFGFIQQLEKQASQLNRMSPFQKTASDLALKDAYQQVAEELKNRLYTGTNAGGQVLGPGADSILSKGLLTPDQALQLHLIHPQLAQEVSNAQTIGDLRKIAAPFVRGSQLANETEAGSQIGFNNVGGAAKGVGKLVQNPLNLLAAPLGSNAVNANVGKAAKAGANALRSLALPSGVGSLAANTTGQSLARLPESISQNPLDMGTAQASSSPIDQIPSQNVQQNNPQDSLRKLIGTVMLSRARSPQELASAYSLLFPFANTLISPQQKEVQANAQSGLRALDIVQQTVAQDPLATLKAKIPIVGQQSSYSAAAREVADVLTRLRTGSALNADEQKFYESQLPQPFDSPERINYKLSLFRNLFTNIANSQIPTQQPSVAM